MASNVTFYAEDKVVDGVFLSKPFTLIMSDNFNIGSLSEDWTSSGANGSSVLSVSSDTEENYNGSAGSVLGAMAVGSDDIWLNRDISEFDLTAIKINFWARIPSVAKRGCKFLKIHGQNQEGPNYANVTFGNVYASGDMTGYSYGDGTNIVNDTTDVIYLDGTYTEQRATPNIITSSEAFSWDDDWHEFEFYHKFNSGTTAENEEADGEVIIKIDTVTRLHANGFFNRHYSNLPINIVGLYGYYDSDSVWELMYDNVEIYRIGS
jgi:hypothetical protein